MNIYYYDPEFHRKHYNCSFYSVDSVPLAQRQDYVLRAVLIVFFIACETLYIPCVMVLRRQMKRSSCYKFMLFIALVNVVSLAITGLTTGIFVILGIVYCSAPTVDYITGFIANC